MHKSAIFSKCGNYRKSLTRRWDTLLPTVNFIMLNPSTADASKDDPTIRRCIGFAKSWGYGAIIVTNLFDYRATNSKELTVVKEPCSKSNVLTCMRWASNVDLVVCAWGSKGQYLQKNREMEKALRERHIEVHYIVFNPVTGYPAHPLYLSKNLKPKLYCTG